jgi:hypothetical protein
VDRIQVAKDRVQLAGYCENGNENSSSIKVGEFLIRWVSISFSVWTLLYEFIYKKKKISEQFKYKPDLFSQAQSFPRKIKSLCWYLVKGYL